MKKLYFIFILCLFQFTYSFAQEYGWVDISNNLPENADLSDLHFIDADTGWISSSSVNKIFKTIDGGVSFTESTGNPTLTTNAIHMVNSTEGFCGGASGLVYRTIDGGIYWSFHGTITNTLTDITFPPSGETGYACGLNGTIYCITTSGTSSMVSGVNGDLSSLSFPLNNAEGWICGGSIVLHYFESNWTADQTGITGSWNSIYFVDNLNGWAVGDYGAIIHTSDGQNWSAQQNLDENSLYDVFFIDTEEGWAAGANGTILHTINGGLNWDIEASGLTTEFLTAVQFTSSTNGYVIGGNKTIVKYTDLTAVEDVKRSFRFAVFPNPTSKMLHIHCRDFKVNDGTAEILSIEGKTVLKQTFESGNESVEIELGGLHDGIYLCRITSGDKTSTKKIIIEESTYNTR